MNSSEKALVDKLSAKGVEVKWGLDSARNSELAKSGENLADRLELRVGEIFFFPEADKIGLFGKKRNIKGKESLILNCILDHKDTEKARKDMAKPYPFWAFRKGLGRIDTSADLFKGDLAAAGEHNKSALEELRANKIYSAFVKAECDLDRIEMLCGHQIVLDKVVGLYLFNKDASSMSDLGSTLKVYTFKVLK